MVLAADIAAPLTKTGAFLTQCRAWARNSIVWLSWRARAAISLEPSVRTPLSTVPIASGIREHLRSGWLIRKSLDLRTKVAANTVRRCREGYFLLDALTIQRGVGTIRLDPEHTTQRCRG